MRIFGAMVVTAALLTGSVSAQQGRSLPDFTVVAASGAVVSSGRLNASEHWLLVYVTPGSVACDRLLRSLDSWATAADAARVVVVAASAPTEVDARIRPLLPSVSSAVSVYADPDGSVARALGLSTAPALVGVASGTLDWMVQGVLNDPRMVEPVVRNWLQRP